MLSKQLETIQVNHASLQAEFKANNEKLENAVEVVFENPLFVEAGAQACNYDFG